MKVGDLCKLKQHCLLSDKWATIISTSDSLRCVKIIFLDDGKIVSALKSNLEVYSESR